MSIRKPPSPDPETLAIAALGWLAADAERLGRFLALTGVEPADIRQVAAESGFLAAVLDHLLADESGLQAFAADQGLDPASIARAREKFPNAPDIHR